MLQPGLTARAVGSGCNHGQSLTPVGRMRRPSRSSATSLPWGNRLICGNSADPNHLHRFAGLSGSNCSRPAARCQKGKAAHISSVELGKNSCWRSNVWTYPGACSRARMRGKVFSYCEWGLCHHSGNVNGDHWPLRSMLRSARACGRRIGCQQSNPRRAPKVGNERARRLAFPGCSV